MLDIEMVFSEACWREAADTDDISSANIDYILTGAGEKEKQKWCSVRLALERKAADIGDIVNIVLTICKIEDVEVKWCLLRLDKEKLILMIITIG